MTKNLIAGAIALALILCALFCGYDMGINKATTSEGWVDEDPEGVAIFVLEVDGNFYEWDISEG